LTVELDPDQLLQADDLLPEETDATHADNISYVSFGWDGVGVQCGLSTCPTYVYISYSFDPVCPMYLNLDCATNKRVGQNGSRAFYVCGRNSANEGCRHHVEAATEHSEFRTHHLAQIELNTPRDLYFVVRIRVVDWIELGQITGICKLDAPLPHRKLPWQASLRPCYARASQGSGAISQNQLSAWLRILVRVALCDSHSSVDV